MVDIAGEWAGTFAATVDETALAGLLAGTATAKEEDQKDERAAERYAPLAAAAAREEWQRLFRRISIAAAADLGTRSGAGCEVAMISPDNNPVEAGMGYQLRLGEAMVAVVLSDQVEMARAEPPRPLIAAPSGDGEAPYRDPIQPVAAGEARRGEASAIDGPAMDNPEIDRKGIELLLGVELEASLRFGSREMALSDLLALGPGDVIQLDRALADPVDLIIGDKIVARGEVVLVNGNFGLQIAEVAEPRKSLESIRCLF
jgi:flagellar motor switch protein FliN/FliY